MGANNRVNLGKTCKKKPSNQWQFIFKHLQRYEFKLPNRIATSKSKVTFKKMKFIQIVEIKI